MKPRQEQEDAIKIFVHHDHDELYGKIVLKHNKLKQGHNIVNKAFILKSFDTF